MRATEWKKRVRPLLPADQEWRFSGTLCYRSPVHRIVLGVLAESSSYSTGVCVWRVTTPLYIPWGGSY